MRILETQLGTLTHFAKIDSLGAFEAYSTSTISSLAKWLRISTRWPFIPFVSSGVISSLTVLLILATLHCLWYRKEIRALRGNCKKLLDKQEDEKHWLACELHDTLLQSIRASELAIENTLLHTDDIVLVRDTLNKSLDWLRRASREGRDTLEALYEETDRTQDLAEALQFAADACIGYQEMVFSLTIAGNPVHFCEAVQNEIYRIGHEAIRNACEHSGGKRLDIDLTYGDHFELRISDDGTGFDLEPKFAGRNGHFGIQTMQRRTSRIGGTLQFEASSGKGTTILLALHGDSMRKSHASDLQETLWHSRC